MTLRNVEYKTILVLLTYKYWALTQLEGPHVNTATGTLGKVTYPSLPLALPFALEGQHK